MHAKDDKFPFISVIFPSFSTTAFRTAKFSFNHIYTYEQCTIWIPYCLNVKIVSCVEYIFRTVLTFSCHKNVIHLIINDECIVTINIIKMEQASFELVNINIDVRWEANKDNNRFRSHFVVFCLFKRHLSFRQI